MGIPHNNQREARPGTRRRPNARRGIACLATAALCAGPALAADTERRAGGVNLGARLGNDTGEGFVDFIVPAHSDDDSIIFFNPRASLKDEGETELNLGLVGRYKLPGRDVILGANAYLDRRESRHGNTFNQSGLGLEVLSQWIDARLNYYHPHTEREMIAEAQMTEVDVDVDVSRSIRRETTTDTDTELIDTTNRGSNTEFEANTILTGPATTERTFRDTTTTTTETTTTLTRTTTTTTTDRFFEQFEEGREGWDAEVMFRLPLPDGFPQTRLGGGYYDYESGFRGGRGIAGAKGRLEMRAGPFLTLDAEVFEDKQLNDTTFFVGARLHLPFDMGRLVAGKNPFAGMKTQIRRHNRAAFTERLDEMVMRDVRIQMEESEFMENERRKRQKVDVEVDQSASTETTTTTKESITKETETGSTETVTKDGDAVTVKHLDSDDTGDDASANAGTFENPHQTAGDANDDALDADITLVHADSAVDDEAIEADDDDRVLGEGDNVVHTVSTDQGTVTLPETAPGARSDPRPTIQGVTINSRNVEVNNFQVVNTGQITTNGSGTTHTDITIRRIQSDGNTSSSVIALGDGGKLDGDITLSDITLTNHSGNGAALSIDNTATSAQVSGDNLSITNVNGMGLSISNAGGTATLTGSTINGGPGAVGIDVTGASSTNRATLNLVNTAVSGGDGGSTGGGGAGIRPSNAHISVDNGSTVTGGAGDPGSSGAGGGAGIGGSGGDLSALAGQALSSGVTVDVDGEVAGGAGGDATGSGPPGGGGAGIGGGGGGRLTGGGSGTDVTVTGSGTTTGGDGGDALCAGGGGGAGIGGGGGGGGSDGGSGDGAENKATAIGGAGGCRGGGGAGVGGGGGGTEASGGSGNQASNSGTAIGGDGGIGGGGGAGLGGGGGGVPQGGTVTTGGDGVDTSNSGTATGGDGGFDGGGGAGCGGGGGGSNGSGGTGSPDCDTSGGATGGKGRGGGADGADAGDGGDGA